MQKRRPARGGADLLAGDRANLSQHSFELQLDCATLRAVEARRG